MSKTTGMAGLQAGIASGGRAGSEGFASRLEQFQRYAPVQAIDFNQITESQKQNRKSEKFMESAVGLTVTPSNTNMYESQYQLAKDKANLLFSDDVIQHYAKDQRSMMEWAGKVDQLKDEIAGYEAFYEDSFGDPSKADGTGNTWADHTVRAKHPGGEEGFWSDMGVEADRTAALNDVMKTVDSRQHSSMTFNTETGEFEYERLVEQDGVPIMDPFVANPQTANELFSYNLSQTIFESPTDFAEKDVFLKVINDRDQFDARMDRQFQKDSFQRAVADNYMKNHPGQVQSIDDVLQDADTLQDAYEEFRDQTYDFAKENERIARRQAAARSQSKKTTKVQPSFSGLIPAPEGSTYQGTFFTQAPVTLTYATEDGTMKTAKFNNIVVDNGELALESKDGLIPLTEGSVAAQQLDAAMGVGTLARMKYDLRNTKLSEQNVTDLPDVKTYEETPEMSYNQLLTASFKNPSTAQGYDTQAEELERLGEIVAMTKTEGKAALEEMYPDLKVELAGFGPFRDFLTIEDGEEDISLEETPDTESYYTSVIELFNAINNKK
tara:strand:+ start:625 stop:2280 length:1656 start_codon:yes stop_codon:yes gene_type:complete